MSQNLLLHSMSEFASLTLPILETIQAKSICEIGAEHGGNTHLLHAWLATRQGRLTSIDSAPSNEFLNWIFDVRDIVTHIHKTGIQAIPHIGGIDAWFFNGDRNWYSVLNELVAAYAVSRNDRKPFLAFVHNIGWPYAQRDYYNDVAQIPANFIQQHASAGGVLPGVAGLVDGGFKDLFSSACAVNEGGPRNGVLTAVADFVALYPNDFFFASIPGVFGLGVIFNRDHAAATQIAQILAPLNAHPLLASLEQNRLANYIAATSRQDHHADGRLEETLTER